MSASTAGMIDTKEADESRDDALDVISDAVQDLKDAAETGDASEWEEAHKQAVSDVKEAVDDWECFDEFGGGNSYGDRDRYRPGRDFEEKRDDLIEKFAPAFSALGSLFPQPVLSITGDQKQYPADFTAEEMTEIEWFGRRFQLNIDHYITSTGPSQAGGVAAGHGTREDGVPATEEPWTVRKNNPDKQAQARFSRDRFTSLDGVEMDCDGTVCLSGKTTAVAELSLRVYWAPDHKTYRKRFRAGGGSTVVMVNGALTFNWSTQVTQTATNQDIGVCNLLGHTFTIWGEKYVSNGMSSGSQLVICNLVESERMGETGTQPGQGQTDAEITSFETAAKELVKDVRATYKPFGKGSLEGKLGH